MVGRPEKGLSPRVRGNLIRPFTRRITKGSIPAGAGEPRESTKWKVAIRVYPRGCGGTRERAAGRSPDTGLSPRVRGNPAALSPFPVHGRSIPAGAGEPTCSRPGRTCPTVYPRGCGGTICGPRRLPGLRGLSPRVRGNQVPQDCPRDECGSIPAGAGEPGPSCWAAGSSTVYPRGCGGTPRMAARSPVVEGLSPRVRGNPAPDSGQRALDRSIPAGAGEPMMLAK